MKQQDLSLDELKMKQSSYNWTAPSRLHISRSTLKEDEFCFVSNTKIHFTCSITGLHDSTAQQLAANPDLSPAISEKGKKAWRQSNPSVATCFSPNAKMSYLREENRARFLLDYFFWKFRMKMGSDSQKVRNLLGWTAEPSVSRHVNLQQTTSWPTF